jgi:hypothetical protein
MDRSVGSKRNGLDFSTNNFIKRGSITFNFSFLRAVRCRSVSPPTASLLMLGSITR